MRKMRVFIVLGIVFCTMLAFSSCGDNNTSEMEDTYDDNDSAVSYENDEEVETESTIIMPAEENTFSWDATTQNGYDFTYGITFYEDTIDAEHSIVHPGNNKIISFEQGEGHTHIIPFRIIVTNKTADFDLPETVITMKLNGRGYWANNTSAFLNRIGFYSYNVDSEDWQWEAGMMNTANQGYMYKSRNSVTDSFAVNGYIELEDVHTPDNPDGFSAEECPPFHPNFHITILTEGTSSESFSEAKTNKDPIILCYKDSEGRFVTTMDKSEVPYVE